MEKEVLEELGLSHAEALIYLALLHLGPSKTGIIIDKTKLQSSTVYHVLGSLVEKGIVSYIYHGKIKYYQTENPEAFLLFLEEKKRKFSEILPLLREKKKAQNQKKSARVYEGVNGLQTTFADILSTMRRGEEYYFLQMSEEDILNERAVLFLQNYHLKRSDKGIKVKGLAIRQVRPFMKWLSQLPYTKIRYLSELTPTSLVIYKNKVIQLDWKNMDTPTAFVIESASVADSYRKFFEQKWKQAKP